MAFFVPLNGHVCTSYYDLCRTVDRPFAKLGLPDWRSLLGSRGLGNARRKPVHLRSLALLLFIFAASAALAAFVGMQYGEVTSQRAVQSPEPAPAPAIQSTQTLAPPSRSAGDGPSSSKPAASIVPTTESTQTRTLGSPSAVEKNNSQVISQPANDAQKAAGSNAVDGLRTTGSNAGQAPNCNAQACSNAYRSFDAADCTYQPANGPRRACRK
jgi:hypothetical protein